MFQGGKSSLTRSGILSHMHALVMPRVVILMLPNMSIPVTKDLMLLDAFAGQGAVSKKYSQKLRIVASLPACDGGFSDTWFAYMEPANTSLNHKPMLLCKKNINIQDNMCMHIHDTVVYCVFTMQHFLQTWGEQGWKTSGAPRSLFKVYWLLPFHCGKIKLLCLSPCPNELSLYWTQWICVLIGPFRSKISGSFFSPARAQGQFRYLGWAQWRYLGNVTASISFWRGQSWSMLTQTW